MTAPGRWRPSWVDVALAAGSCVLVLLPEGHRTWTYVAAVFACIALVVRRRWPRLVLLATFPATVGGLGLIPAVLALHALGRRLPRLHAVWPWMLAAFVAMMMSAVFPAVSFGPLSTADWVLTAVLVGGAATAPVLIGALQATRAELAGRVTELRRAETDRDLALTAQATVEERNRIAREVHDIVAHYASLIAVQASGLEARTTDPETATTARRLRELSSSALDEMRTAVSLWSVDAPLEPPVLDCWTGWVLQPAQAAEQAGVPLRTEVDEALPRPEAPQLRVLRRTVQEGVANAVHHGAGPVTVTLAGAGDAVMLRIRNPMQVSRTEPGHPRGGRGLIGLRERVAQVGGTVQAGPTADGGWLLEATVPGQVAAATERKKGSSA